MRVRASNATEATLLRRLVPVAEEHGGLVSVAEAQQVGVSNRMLLHYASAGDLERVHRGVYRLVWLPHHRFADVIAACLRVGHGAVAVDDTAAAVWGLGDAMPAQITIGVPRPWRGGLPGVRIVVRDLAIEERTVRDNVPVTTMERTLADLAQSDPTQTVETVETVARRTGLISERAWRRATRRYPLLASQHSMHSARRCEDHARQSGQNAIGGSDRRWLPSRPAMPTAPSGCAGAREVWHT